MKHLLTVQPPTDFLWTKYGCSCQCGTWHVNTRDSNWTCLSQTRQQETKIEKVVLTIRIPSRSSGASVTEREKILPTQSLPRPANIKLPMFNSLCFTRVFNFQAEAPLLGPSLRPFRFGRTWFHFSAWPPKRSSPNCAEVDGVRSERFV